MGQPQLAQPAAYLPFIVGAVAFVVALFLTPEVRNVAVARGWVCKPRADRWSTRTVALMGGIAIVAATSLAGIFLAGWLDKHTIAVLGSSLFMFVVGLVDDRISIKPHSKIIAQVFAALWLVQSGLHFGVGASHFAILDVAITILWVVFVGNALNLLDNMDGLCAGVAAVAGGCLSVIDLQLNDTRAATLTLALCGACLGYLKYNRHPASVFMGDCGSLFIGQFLAGATLLMQSHSSQRGILGVVALPVLVMLIPVMDTTLVTIARKWSLRPISQGGRDHSSHRLVAMGLSEELAVQLLWGLSLVGGLTAIMLMQLGRQMTNILAPIIFGCIALLAWYLLRVRVYDDPDNLGEKLEHTEIPLLADHRYRRRMGEVIYDTLAVVFGFYAAFALRFEAAMEQTDIHAALMGALPSIVIAHIAAYFVVGIYRGIWRYTSAKDIPRFVGGVLLSLIFSVVLLHITGHTVLSRSIYVINALIQFALLAGSRFSLRMMRDALKSRAQMVRPALLIGLAESAEAPLRRLTQSNPWRLRPAGVICEDDHMVGLRILDLPVLGTSADIENVIATNKIEGVVLIDEHYPADRWEHIRSTCAAAHIDSYVYRATLDLDEEDAQ